MTELLRQYAPEECGEDGYPFAWHRETLAEDQSLGHAGDGPLLNPAIKDYIREQALNRCERCWHPYEKGMGEWSTCDEGCRHGGPLQVVEREEGWPDRTYKPPSWQDITSLRSGGLAEIAIIEAQYRILTVHHLDSDKANCRWWNLVALCQRCHLVMQRKVVMGTPYHYEHSEWFKPYAAAFYAFKYLGEDLDRPTVMGRQDELLALEYQGTQEALL